MAIIVKLIIAIVNNDDSPIVSSALTKEGYFITKLSTTGGFLMSGNTTLLIGAESDKIPHIKEIIARHSSTRSKEVSTRASYGNGLFEGQPSANISVSGATVIVLDVESFEKL